MSLSTAKRMLAKIFTKILKTLEDEIHIEDDFQNVNYDKVAFLLRHMAETGEGTDKSYELGVLPMPIGYYSPVPDLKDLDQRNVWEKKSAMAGINFQPEKQLEFMEKVGRAYGQECEWPMTSSGNPDEFFVNNGSFSYGCASALHSMIRFSKPKRVIEIGSGFSSLIIAEALKKNKAETGESFEYTVIDPYPNTTIQGLDAIHELIVNKVELVDLDVFKKLSKDDILFIDSGHTVRIGGDVNFLFLEVLPLLDPGVIVHVHDVGLPYEYPRVYYSNPKFRVLWTEAYLLQAFLIYNSEFEILLAMAYLQTEHFSKFKELYPHFDPTTHFFGSGSYWIRRKVKPDFEVKSP